MVLWQLPSTVRSLESIMKIVDFTLYTWASEWEGHLEAILNNFLASNTWFTIAESYIKYLYHLIIIIGMIRQKIWAHNLS